MNLIKKYKIIFTSLVSLTLIVFYVWFFTPAFTLVKYLISPDYPKDINQTIYLDGLENPIVIHLDPYGIPHIEAKNKKDLIYAVGYMQGRYRFFQMDLLRRFASGTLSELVGEQKILGSTTVAFDLAMRGWDFVGRSKINSESDDTYRAFAQGVNQALKQNLPIEYRLLEIKPKPWTLEDSLAIALLQSWSITHNWEQEAVRLSLALELGFDRAEKIYPNEPLKGSTTLPAGRKRALPPAINKKLKEFISALSISPQKHSQRRSRNKASIKTNKGFAISSMAELRPSASNVWVISGKKSKSGKPILANDMHLSHMVPSLIFAMHLKSPDLHVAGVTLPGLPFVVAGFNGFLAWGSTAAVADAVDLVIEKTNGPNSIKIWHGSCAIKTKEIIIKIRDGNSFKQRRSKLRVTCHGPSFNDMYPGYLPPNAPLVSIKWDTSGLSNSLDALYNINKAKTIQELHQQFKQLPVPTANYMVADINGNIAFFTTGHIPDRKFYRGTFAAAGWMQGQPSTKFIKWERMPFEENPKSNQFINTNNLILPPGYGPLLQVDSAPSYRADRVKQQLNKKTSLDSVDMSIIQTDKYAIRGKYLTKFIIDDLKNYQSFTNIETEAFEILKQWNFETTSDSIGASLFYSVYREAILFALQDELSDSALRLFLKQRYSTNVCDKWFEDSEHAVWDNLKTRTSENRKDIIVAAFHKAIVNLKEKYGSNLSDWKWGQLHRHHPKHIFGKKLFLSAFNLKDIALGGALDTIWKAHFNLTNREPFKTVAGPAVRMIFDLNNTKYFSMILDTGMSGWPLSPHYDDMYELWQKGKLLSMQYQWKRVKASTRATIYLVPKKK